MGENVEQGRNADILQSIIDSTEYTDPPQSRIEDLLLQLKELIEEGGGGGEAKELTNDQLKALIEILNL